MCDTAIKPAKLGQQKNMVNKHSHKQMNTDQNIPIKYNVVGCWSYCFICCNILHHFQNCIGPWFPPALFNKPKYFMQIHDI